jgi:hypothetical protein
MTMSNEHSPGPWKWERTEGDHGDDCLRDADGNDVIEGEWMLGAADARLIAAAPEMLALLRRYDEYLTPRFGIPKELTDILFDTKLLLERRIDAKEPTP